MGVFWLKHIPATFSVSPVPGKQNGMLTQVNTMFLNSFFFATKTAMGSRLYLPKKPPLTETNLSDKDYCEMSTKFKAAHIKVMIFWVAKKSQEAADATPDVPKTI